MGRSLKATGPVSVSQDALSRKLLAKERAEVRRSALADEPVVETVEPAVQYGRRFAETQSRFRMKRAQRYEELGDEGAGTYAGGEPSRPEVAPKQARRVTAELPEVPVMPRGLPIGAMPVVDEPYPPQRLKDLSEHAARRVQAVTHAANDLWQASLKVLTLPRDAAELLARRLQILKLG